MAKNDDLQQIPWWDAKALRMADTIERSIVRLRLDGQGEFLAITNAIAMQLESPDTVPEVVRLLVGVAPGPGRRTRHRKTTPAPP